MRRLAVLAAVAALALSAGNVAATPGFGATSAILAQGVFDPISTSHTGGLEGVIQDVTIAPGGHTGWHSHPGGTVVIVESGTFSFYNDSCVKTDTLAGRGVVEPGGGVQLARNESATVPLVLTVVYFDIASPDGPVRTDAAAPGCAAGASLPTTASGSGVTAAIVDRATFAASATITGADERDVVVQSATFAPGGHSGWHSHPGATVIFVVSGTFSFYPATTCERVQYTAGQGVVEPGGGIQLARNEETVPLVLFVVYFDVPTATPGAFRIDQPEPANCTGLAAVPASPTATPIPDTAAGAMEKTAPSAPLAVLLAFSAILAASVGVLAAVRISHRR